MTVQAVEALNTLYKSVKAQGYVNFNGNILLHIDQNTLQGEVLSTYDQTVSGVRRVFKPVSINHEAIIALSQLESCVTSPENPSLIYVSWQEVKDCIRSNSIAQ